MARDVYAELGVRKVINAAGTYTMVGGSRMSDETLAAMAQAAKTARTIWAVTARQQDYQRGYQSIRRQAA